MIIRSIMRCFKMESRLR